MGGMVRNMGEFVFLRGIEDWNFRGLFSGWGFWGTDWWAGGDDRVSASMDNYRPEVRCAAGPPLSSDLRASCQEILDTMPASTGRLAVEAPGSSGVRQTLLSCGWSSAWLPVRLLC